MNPVKPERVRDLKHLRELAKAGAWVNPPCLMTVALFSPILASQLLLEIPSEQVELLIRHGITPAHGPFG